MRKRVSEASLVVALTAFGVCIAATARAQVPSSKPGATRGENNVDRTVDKHVDKKVSVCQQANALLPAPAGFTATDLHARTQTGQVTLHWQPVLGANSYKIFRSWPSVYYDHAHAHDSGRDHNLMANILDPQAWSLVLPGNANSATISDLPLFFTVHFQIAAVKDVSVPMASKSQVIACQGIEASTSIAPSAAPDAPVWGFADTHTHQFANLAIGGYMVGKAYGPPDDALAGDYEGHGLFVGQLPHRPSGYPQFDSWPTANTKIHQQMYEDWLYRAFLGGMKLMVMHGESTESLCIALTGAREPEMKLESQALASAAAVPAGTVAGAGAGAGAGSALGSALGSFFLPGIGTVLGGIVGGAGGGAVGAPSGAAALPAFFVSVDALSGAVKAHIQQSQGAVPGCNDMAVATHQIQEAKNMEAYLNNQCALGADPPRCPQKGMGWYHIVQSAEEARSTINRGQMAVVLGIEVDRLFNCAAFPLGDPRAGGHTCTIPEVHQSLDYLVASGVRHIFPAHLADSAFGGMAIYSGPVTWNINNHFLNGTWIDTAKPTCPAELFADPAFNPIPPKILFDFNKNENPPELASVLAAIEGLGFNPNPPFYPPATPIYPQDTPGHCNGAGLTPLGRALIPAMMDRHLIIDIDHMSRHTVNDTLHFTWELRKDSPYPIAMGHNAPLNIINMNTAPQQRTERLATDNELLYLRVGGGLIGVGIGGGTNTSEIHEYTPQFHETDWGFHTKNSGVWTKSIPNDCSNSSKTWVQSYLYTVDHLGGPKDAAVAFASDQLLVDFLGPRFGYDEPQVDVFKEVVRGCGGRTATKNGVIIPEKSLQNLATQVRYPLSAQNPGVPIRLEKSHLGNKSWDFNYDGMAHIGMYPDLIQDAVNIGLAPSDLDPIFRSAEGYIKMWEKAERPYGSQAPPTAATNTSTRSIVDRVPLVKPAIAERLPAAVATLTPALAVSVCRTLNGSSCVSDTIPHSPGSTLTAIVTVTSGATAVQGASVAVGGQSSSAHTNQNGIAVISYQTCVSPGANPAPIACEARITKSGFQEVIVKLP